MVSVVVHAGGVPRYVRIIPGVGGDSITQAVQHNYQWSWEDAERTKVFVGLPGHANLDESQRPTVTTRDDGLDHPAQKVVVTAATSLVAEISTTLDFYRASAIEAAAAGGSEQPTESPACSSPAPAPGSAACASCSSSGSAPRWSSWT